MDGGGRNEDEQESDKGRKNPAMGKNWEAGKGTSEERIGQKGIPLLNTV